MKLTRRRVWKLAFSLGLFAIVAAGALALSSSPAEARPRPIPGPLCGWTAVWDCTLPDGSHETVIGTQCDIAKFQRKTGATCVPQ